MLIGKILTRIKLMYFVSLIQYLDPKDSTMWWAGKEFRADKKVSDYTGKN